MLTDKQRETRQLFEPIAVVEHHQLLEPKIDVYDICERLGPVWAEIQVQAVSRTITLAADCVQGINAKIAQSFGITPSAFRNEEKWVALLTTLEECGCIDDGNIVDDPHHPFSWLFSAIYWDHVSQCRLSTAWMFTSALRIQSGFPECRLKVENLGPFLESLSGSGPPIYDGQTFYPEDYST